MQPPKKNIFALIVLMLFFTACQPSVPAIQKEKNFIPLSDQPGNLSRPVWAPSGREIAASTFSYPQYHSAIYIFELETEKKRLLVETNGRINAQSWSPDGKLIVFVSLGSEDFKEGIWIVEISGKNPSYLGEGNAAAWSPDGKRIAVLSCKSIMGNKTRVAEIRLMNMTTQGTSTFEGSDPCVSDFYMTWASNSNLIAYSYSRTASLDQPADRVFILDPSSGMIRSPVDNWSWSPTWNTDGRWVAFVEGKSQGVTSTVSFYDSEGGCGKSLDLSSFPMVGEISWSPDGTKLALSTAGEIYIVGLQAIVGRNFLECQ